MDVYIKIFDDDYLLSLTNSESSDLELFKLRCLRFLKSKKYEILYDFELDIHPPYALYDIIRIDIINNICGIMIEHMYVLKDVLYIYNKNKIKKQIDQKSITNLKSKILDLSIYSIPITCNILKNNIPIETHDILIQRNEIGKIINMHYAYINNNTMDTSKSNIIYKNGNLYHNFHGFYIIDNISIREYFDNAINTHTCITDIYGNKYTVEYPKYKYKLGMLYNIFNYRYYMPATWTNINNEKLCGYVTKQQNITGIEIINININNNTNIYKLTKVDSQNVSNIYVKCCICYDEGCLIFTFNRTYYVIDCNPPDINIVACYLKYIKTPIIRLNDKLYINKEYKNKI